MSDASVAIVNADTCQCGNRVAFQVRGKPETAGSKRAFVVNGKPRITDANPRGKAWRSLVVDAALDALPDGFDLLRGPIRLAVTFYRLRPKCHFRTGANSHLIRESAPQYPTTAPDATKYLRLLEDSLTGIVWRDDAQIVDQHVQKRYHTWAGADVLVIEL